MVPQAFRRVRAHGGARGGERASWSFQGGSAPPLPGTRRATCHVPRVGRLDPRDRLR
jgi:hypothetical protein